MAVCCGHFTWLVLWPGGHGSPVPLMDTLNLSFYASTDLEFLIFEMGLTQPFPSLGASADWGGQSVMPLPCSAKLILGETSSPSQFRA